MPDSPTDLPKESFVSVLKRTVAQFKEDQLTTWAAALTYYSVLSIFPALLALVSLLGLVAKGTIDTLIDELGSVAPGPAREILTNALTSLQNSQATGLMFFVGLGLAIWSASGYIGAFMDAANTVWDVKEGRPIYKKLPLRVGITVVMLVLLTVGGLAAVLTGPIAEKVGDVIGLGSTFVSVWDIAKWPVLILLVSAMMSLLYYLAPNVKHPKFPWVTPGGVVAVVLWLLASAIFALYVANFPNNKTYGAFGGVIFFLTWLWISNIAILFGAELNSELERSKAIAEGHPPEKEPFLPVRDEPDEKAEKRTQEEAQAEAQRFARTSNEPSSDRTS